MLQGRKAVRAKHVTLFIAGVSLLAAFLGNDPARAFATGQQAVCTHPSHSGVLKWSGPCRSNGQADADVDNHFRANPTHKLGEYLSTTPCTAGKKQTASKKQTGGQEQTASQKQTASQEQKPAVGQTKSSPDPADPAKKKKKKKKSSPTGVTAPSCD